MVIIYYPSLFSHEFIRSNIVRHSRNQKNPSPSPPSQGGDGGVVILKVSNVPLLARERGRVIDSPLRKGGTQGGVKKLSQTCPHETRPRESGE